MNIYNIISGYYVMMRWILLVNIVYSGMLEYHAIMYLFSAVIGSVVYKDAKHSNKVCVNYLFNECHFLEDS